jgi:prevent-host-death family protein
MAHLNSTLTASDARANFYQLLTNVVDNLSQFTIKIRGKGDAVVMSAAELDGWKETLEIMSDKKLMASLNRAMKSKKTYTQEEVDKILKW